MMITRSLEESQLSELLVQIEVNLVKRFIAGQRIEIFMRYSIKIHCRILDDCPRNRKIYEAWQFERLPPAPSPTKRIRVLIISCSESLDPTTSSSEFVCIMESVEYSRVAPPF